MSHNDIRLDPRVRRTRQLLQRALADLLHEKPFQSITVQDIAARAEVNRATFYAHFEDKYALLNYSVRDMFQRMLDRRLPDAAGFTPDSLRILTLATCEYMAEFLGHCAPSGPNNDQTIIFSQVQAHIYELLLGWIKKADLHLSASPEAAAMAASWAIFGSAFQWAQQGRRLPAEQVARQVLAVLVSGLGAFPG